MSWQYEPDVLCAALQAAGYQVTADATGVAAWQKAPHAKRLTIDAGGRVKLKLTYPLSTPRTQRTEAEGHVAIVLCERREIITLTCELHDAGELATLLPLLEKLVGRE